MLYGANKSNSAAQIVRALAMDCKPIEVKHRGIKKIAYREYMIHVYPLLQPGKLPSCIIGLDGTGICHKLGLPAAKEWVDADINSKKPKLRCRVKIITKVIIDCPHCSGSGENRNGKICRYCKGEGTKQ